MFYKRAKNKKGAAKKPGIPYLKTPMSEKYKISRIEPYFYKCDDFKKSVREDHSSKNYALKFRKNAFLQKSFPLPRKEGRNSGTKGKN